MRPAAIHQTSRGDPLWFVCILALIGCAIPSALRAQDAPVGGPADAIARTAARAMLAPDVPDEQPIPVVPIVTGGEPEGLFGEPRLINRGINFATRTLGAGTGTGSGFYPEFSNMPTGSGWISLGPGYRHWLNGDRVVVEGSAAISWRSYKMLQGRFELPTLARSRIAVGSQVMWQDLTQTTYYGIGSTTADADRSEYRLTYTDVVGYATARPRQWLAITGRLGYLTHPSLLSPAGTFKRGNPDALLTFASDTAIALPDQPDYVHAQGSIVADTRNSRSHPTKGGVYRTAWTSYSDRGSGAFTFQQYEAEAAHFVPLVADTLVLVGHAWLVGTDTTAGHQVPFYLMPSLGGHNTLRGYTDFRFHDRNMAVVNAEARVAILTHIDLAGFVDAGSVAARFGDLNLDKTSWGFGVQAHTERATFARVEIAHGAEGWRLLFRTSDPFHLSRLSRRTAAVPFVP